jgi:hypothetical protein
MGEKLTSVIGIAKRNRLGLEGKVLENVAGIYVAVVDKVMNFFFSMKTALLC